jgi:FMN phosphatase YigB (HAD superfamily)
MSEGEAGGLPDVDVVTLAFRGGLVDWRSAVEAVLYDTARRHGESPLDRGRALRRQLEALETATGAPGSRFATAFDALAAARGYRWARPGAQALQRVVAGCAAFADVAPGLERATLAGLDLVAVADADAEAVHAALRPLDGAVRDVVCAHEAGPARGARAALACAVRRAGVAPARVLHVGTGPEQLGAAASLGIRAAWLNRLGAPPWPGATFCLELRSLHDLADLAAGRPAVAAG